MFGRRSGEWRGNEGIVLTVSRELHNLYCSPKINWLGEEKMRWVGRVARQGEKKCVCEVLSTNLAERKRLEYLGIGWRIILKQDLQENNVRL